MNNKAKKLISIVKPGLVLAELTIIFVVVCNIWVYEVTRNATFTKISKVPPREVALVLGTSPKTRGGRANPYFISRMAAAALLYHHYKVKKIIVSGEKSPYYDEPLAMKNFLVKENGVPEEAILMDSKGFSTASSIQRAKSVYKQKNIIIVSQGYHNLRALFYARNIGLNALGYDAQDIESNESFYRNHVREILARVQAVIFYVSGAE